MTIAPSKGSTVFFAWLILILFLVLLVTGWKHLIEPSVGDGFLATVVAGFLALLGFLAARYISQYRAHIKQTNTQAPWHTGWHAYLLLMVLSAIGTLNAAFVLFESRPMLRHDIALVRNSYDQLWTEGKQYLPPPGYNNKLDRIESLLRSLHEEIVNPNKGYCGYGVGAAAIVRKITDILPQYTFIRGSGQIKPCDERAELLYKSYDSMAREMLKHDKDFAASRGAERLQFLDELQGHYEHWKAALGDLENKASGFGGTSSLPLQSLYNARREFNSDRQHYVNLVADANPGIAEITALQSEHTGYAATFALLVQRSRDFSTWLYLAISFGIDFALIYFLTLLYMQFSTQAKVNQSDLENYPERFETDPKFLWVPPKQLSR